MPNPVVNRRLLAGSRQSFNSLISGLKGFWPLNDSLGNIQNGTIKALYSDKMYAFSAPNTALVSSPGIAGLTPCADFHTNRGLGFAERIESSDAGLQLAANTQFTVTAWVNFSSLVSFAPVVSTWGSDGFFLGLSPATFDFNVHDAGGTGRSVTGATPSTGVWYFMAGGWDGTNAWLQVNAGARATTACATVHVFTSDFTIGNYPGGTTLFTDGLIAGVGYWIRTLSTAEITKLYNAGVPLANPFLS